MSERSGDPDLADCLERYFQPKGRVAVPPVKFRPAIDELDEELLRAALGDAGAIERVESLMSELARLGELNKLPEGFDDLWQVARQAFGSKR